VAATMISSDSHVVEPPELWLERIDRRHLDQAPRVVSDGGADWWIVDEEVAFSASAPARAGERFLGQDRLIPKFPFSTVRPAAYVPDEFLKENETDGVWGSVLYPSLGCVFFSVKDSGLLSAICRAYNDWVAEFCQAAPGRLKGVAMIATDDVGDAVAELERVRERGLVGGAISVSPPADATYDLPRYEPLWATAQDLGMPLSLHIASNRTPGEWRQLFRPAMGAAPDHWVRLALGDMIMGGVFERFPDLKVVSVEHESGWVPYFVSRLDYVYTQMERAPDAPVFADAALPSDFYRRNVLVSFQEDPIGIRHLDVVGAENLMWGSDYPHTESTFPRSQEMLDALLVGVDADVRRQITSTNAARLYGFDPPAADPE
jgi:predicted TIM-barrel fold metal-dependent hydrolase